MSGLEGEYEVDWTWRTVDDYLSCLEDLDLGPNIAFLAPHGNIRLTIMGLDDREPTLDELKAMENLLERSIEEGAFGMSTGMIYPPCCFAKTDEFIALGKILKKKDAVFVTHQRSEADYILESMDEIFTIGRGSGCKTHFSHFKVAGKKNWDKLPKVFEKLDTAQSYGIVISYDQYPYVAGSTMLGAILPPWVHDGGTEKLLERLKNPEIRERIKKDILNGIPGWDNFIEFAGLDGIYITFVKSERNRKLVGKNLVEIAEIKKKILMKPRSTY